MLHPIFFMGEKDLTLGVPACLASIFTETAIKEFKRIKYLFLTSIFLLEERERVRLIIKPTDYESF